MPTAATVSPFVLWFRNNTVVYTDDEVYLTLQGKIPGDSSGVFYFYDYDGRAWDEEYDAAKHSRSVQQLDGRITSPYVESGIFYLSLDHPMSWPKSQANPSPSNSDDPNYETLWQAIELTILPQGNSGLNTTCVDFFSFPLGLRLDKFSNNQAVGAQCGFKISRQQILDAFAELPATYDAFTLKESADVLRVLAPHQLFGFPVADGKPDYTDPKPWTQVMYDYLEVVWSWYGADGGRSLWVDVSEIEEYASYTAGMIGTMDAAGSFVFVAVDKSGTYPPDETFEKPPIQYTQDGLFGGHFEYTDPNQQAYFTTENKTVRSVISKNFLTALNYGLLAYQTAALRFPDAWRGSDSSYFANQSSGGQEQYNAFAKVVYDTAFEHRCYGFSYSDVAGNDSFLSYDPAAAKEPVGTITLQPFSSQYLISEPAMAEPSASASAVTLSWTMATSGCTFDVYRNNEKVNTAPISDMSFTDQGLEDGLYYYQVVASKAFAVSGEQRSVSTESGLVAARVGPDEHDANVNWAAGYVGSVTAAPAGGAPISVTNNGAAPISANGTKISWTRLQESNARGDATVYLVAGQLSFEQDRVDAAPRGSLVLTSSGSQLVVALGAGVPG